MQRYQTKLYNLELINHKYTDRKTNNLKLCSILRKQFYKYDEMYDKKFTCGIISSLFICRIILY